MARATGLQIHVLRASIDREIDAAFNSIAQTAHRRTLGGQRLRVELWLVEGVFMQAKANIGHFN